MMTNYVRLLSNLDKAHSGPITDEKLFEMEMIPNKIQELQKKFDIRYDRELVVPADDAFAATAFFAAGLELAESIGVLCKALDEELHIPAMKLKRDSGMRQTRSKRETIGIKSLGGIVVPNPTCHPETQEGLLDRLIQKNSS